MNDGKAGYYGRPIVKPPEWSALIPAYFWAGGWAGASATLALGARLAKNERAARTLVVASASGCAISAFCLIADLKRPERFHHMMRVFKPSSPMSVGVYLFGLFSSASFAAAASELSGVARPLGRMAEAVAGLTGPLMSVYTSVLIADTAMPAWHHARRSLPALFAATSASTAGGLGLYWIAPQAARPARRIAVLGSAGVGVALTQLRREVGSFQHEAYERGKAGRLSRFAKALNLGGALGTLFAHRSQGIAKVAGAMLLAAGLAERFAVYHAGKASAEDPKFTIAAQSGDR